MAHLWSKFTKCLRALDGQRGSRKRESENQLFSRFLFPFLTQSRGGENPCATQNAASFGIITSLLSPSHALEAPSHWGFLGKIIYPALYHRPIYSTIVYKQLKYIYIIPSLLCILGARKIILPSFSLIPQLTVKPFSYTTSLINAPNYMLKAVSHSLFSQLLLLNWKIYIGLVTNLLLENVQLYLFIILVQPII